MLPRKTSRQPRTSNAGHENEKTTDQLEIEVSRLQSLLEERKAQYEDLQNMANNDTAAAESEDADVEDQIRMLTSRNNLIKKKLKAMADLERQYATDPKVMDKRNEVKAVQLEISGYERELYTLQAVKKRRDKGLKELNVSEEKSKKAKRQQNEMKAEAREKIKELESELRALSAEDIQVHEQLAICQEQVKLGVTTQEAEDLQRKLEEQERTIQTLKLEEKEWKQRREGMRDEGQGNIARQRRELQKLENEVEHLRKVLVQREGEHKRSYQNNFNGNEKYYVA